MTESTAGRSTSNGLIAGGAAGFAGLVPGMISKSGVNQGKCAHGSTFHSKGKIRFQSFFMLITVQPRCLASAMSASENVPIFDAGP